jgi:hypothetical protein
MQEKTFWLAYPQCDTIENDTRTFFRRNSTVNGNSQKYQANYPELVKASRTYNF